MSVDGTERIGFRLSKQPTENVVVNVDLMVPSGSEATVDLEMDPTAPHDLTFTMDNWDEEQFVEVSANAVSGETLAANLDFSLVIGTSTTDTSNEFHNLSSTIPGVVQPPVLAGELFADASTDRLRTGRWHSVTISLDVAPSGNVTVRWEVVNEQDYDQWELEGNLPDDEVVTFTPSSYEATVRFRNDFRDTGTGNRSNASEIRFTTDTGETGWNGLTDDISLEESSNYYTRPNIRHGGPQINAQSGNSTIQLTITEGSSTAVTVRIAGNQPVLVSPNPPGSGLTAAISVRFEVDTTPPNADTRLSLNHDHVIGLTRDVVISENGNSAMNWLITLTTSKTGAADGSVFTKITLYDLDDGSFAANWQGAELSLDVDITHVTANITLLQPGSVEAGQWTAVTADLEYNPSTPVTVDFSTTETRAVFFSGITRIIIPGDRSTNRAVVSVRVTGDDALSDMPLNVITDTHATDWPGLNDVSDDTMVSFTAATPAVSLSLSSPASPVTVGRFTPLTVRLTQDPAGDVDLDFTISPNAELGQVPSFGHTVDNDQDLPFSARATVFSTTQQTFLVTVISSAGGASAAEFNGLEVSVTITAAGVATPPDWNVKFSSQSDSEYSTPATSGSPLVVLATAVIGGANVEYDIALDSNWPPVEDVVVSLEVVSGGSRVGTPSPEEVTFSSTDYTGSKRIEIPTMTGNPGDVTLAFHLKTTDEAYLLWATQNNDELRSELTINEMAMATGPAVEFDFDAADVGSPGVAAGRWTVLTVSLTADPADGQPVTVSLSTDETQSLRFDPEHPSDDEVGRVVITGDGTDDGRMAVMSVRFDGYLPNDFDGVDILAGAESGTSPAITGTSQTFEVDFLGISNAYFSIQHDGTWHHPTSGAGGATPVVTVNLLRNQEASFETRLFDGSNSALLPEGSVSVYLTRDDDGDSRVSVRLGDSTSPRTDAWTTYRNSRVELGGTDNVVVTVNNTSQNTVGQATLSAYVETDDGAYDAYKRYQGGTVLFEVNVVPDPDVGMEFTGQIVPDDSSVQEVRVTFSALPEGSDVDVRISFEPSGVVDLQSDSVLNFDSDNHGTAQLVEFTYDGTGGHSQIRVIGTSEGGSETFLNGAMDSVDIPVQAAMPDPMPPPTPDPDPAPMLEVGGGSAVVAGRETQVNIRLTAAPSSGDVVVDLNSGDGAVVINPAQIRLNSGNAMTGLPVRVRHNANLDSDKMVDINISTSGNPDTRFNGLTATQRVTFQPNTAMVLQAPQPTSPSVEGANILVTVRLGAVVETGTQVVVDAAISQGGSRAMLLDASQTFTQAGSTGQQVFRIAVPETAGRADDFPVAVDFSIGSGTTDRAYELRDSTVMAQVMVTDSAAPAPGRLSVSHDGNISLEEGETFTVTVALSVVPTTDITVGFYFDSPAPDTQLLALSPSDHTFTPATWNRPVEVVVTAPENEYNNRYANGVLSETLVLDLDPDVSSDIDPNFASAVTTPVELPVEVRDDDTPGVSVAPSGSIRMEIGEEVPINIVLDTLPQPSPVHVDVELHYDVDAIPDGLDFGLNMAGQADVDFLFDDTDWNDPAEFVVIATPSDPDTEVELEQDISFTISVIVNPDLTDDPDYDALRAQTINGVVRRTSAGAPEHVRTVVGSAGLGATQFALNVVGEQIAGIDLPDPVAFNLSRPAEATERNAGPWDAGETGWRSDFQSLFPDDIALVLPFGEATDTLLWARFGYHDFSGTSEFEDQPATYDGSAVAIMYGLGWKNKSDSTFGLALSHTNSSSDLDNAGDAVEVEQEVTTFHPYFGMEISESNRAWVVGSLGGGDINVKLDDGSTIKTDIAAQAIGMGVESLWQMDDINFASRFEGLIGSSKLDASEEFSNQGIVDADGNPIETESLRLRAELEASKPYRLETGKVIHPYVLVAGRFDGGDLDGLSSVEFGGGVRAFIGEDYAIDLKGRFQLGGDEHKEHSVSGRLSYDSGADRRGLVASVSPAIDDGTWEVESKVGYGWGASVLGQRGVFGPSLNYRSDDDDLTSRVGFDSDRLGMHLESDSSESEVSIEYRSF